MDVGRDPDLVVFLHTPGLRPGRGRLLGPGRPSSATTPSLTSPESRPRSPWSDHPPRPGPIPVLRRDLWVSGPEYQVWSCRGVSWVRHSGSRTLGPASRVRRKAPGTHSAGDDTAPQPRKRPLPHPRSLRLTSIGLQSSLRHSLSPFYPGLTPGSLLSSPHQPDRDPATD